MKLKQLALELLTSIAIPLLINYLTNSEEESEKGEITNNKKMPSDI